MTLTQEQQRPMLQVAQAVIDAVKAAGNQGAPGGVLYAALMGHGCTLIQFQAIMAALCDTQKLRKSGELYFWVADIIQVAA